MSSIEMAQILLRQCVVIFLLFALGVLLQRLGIFNVAAARQVCNLILVAVMPALLIDLLQRPFLPEELGLLGVALVAVMIFYLLAIPLTRLVFRGKDGESDRIKRTAVICSNVGFVGIPLVSVVIGDHALLFVVVYIVVFNLHFWTHGVSMLRGETKIQWREIITCPVLVASAVGLLFYFCNIQLPPVLRDTFGYLTGLNTPLPTLLTGVFIAELSVRQIITDKRVLFVCLMRLVILPLLLIGALWTIGISGWISGAKEVLLAVIICAACPCAMNTFLLPGKMGMDTTFGANIVAQSNLFCILTIPVIAMIARAVFQM